MPITFKVKGADAAKAAEEAKPAPEAQPEKAATSKQKLGGTKAAAAPKKTAAAQVEVTKKDNKTGQTEVVQQGSEDTGIEITGEPALVQTPVVGYSFGFTHNAGDFQSYRAQVWLSMPVAADEINEGFDLVKAWVDDKVMAIHAEITA
ncbi:hypothetical protein EVC30_029 [Rhizobium phage RHph_Y1_11]|nr:hypothetical protein EVC30_029 [Rhizobium phage RHph_Y1_11]